VSSAAPSPTGSGRPTGPTGPDGRVPTPRHGPRTVRVPLWLLGAVALAWTVLWSGVAWTAWQDSRADRELTDHGAAVVGVVTAAPPGGEIKLGYCRQQLQLTAPGHGTLSVPAVRWCAQPWTAGASMAVVVDPANAARAVPADAVQPAGSTHLVPIVVAAVAALLAGFPLGRLFSAVERRRDEKWYRSLTDR